MISINQLLIARSADRVTVAGMSLNVDEMLWHLQRIESKSKIIGECWEWSGYTKNGYGSLSVRNKDVYIHAISFAIVHGDLDGGEEIRHSCDNRKCWRPIHLLAGTRADNVHDAQVRGRFVNPPRTAGLNQHLAKLTDAQVQEIRERVDELQRVLAAEYECSQSTIWRLRHNKVRI